MCRSQTGIILNVQHQLEDILNNQQIIVQNQNDMFDKLNDIEKRLMNVETCLIIQQQSGTTTGLSNKSISASTSQNSSVNSRTNILSKSSPGNSPSLVTSSNNNHSNHKLKGNHYQSSSRLSLLGSTPSSFARSQALHQSPRLSQLSQHRFLMQQHLSRHTAFGSSLPVGHSSFFGKYSQQKFKLIIRYQLQQLV